MSLVNGLRQENEDLRFRTGSGTPEGNVLLGGSLKGEGTFVTFGGGGSVGATSRLARSSKDVRLAAVAGGTYGQPGSGTGGGGAGGRTDSPTRRQSRK